MRRSRTATSIGYYEIASASGRPYVDYQVEHPIGTLLVFKLIAKAAGTRSSFGRGAVLVSSSPTPC